MGCVLVTGASGGIGGTMAEAFAREGYKVALQGNTRFARAERLAAELNAQGLCACAVKADVSSLEEVEALFAGLEAQFAPVSVLINNAGIAQQKQFQDIDYAEWKGMFAVNVDSAYLCSKRALPWMLSQKRGCIINISSIWGQVGASCEVHYSAAKAALIGMTRALAKELAPSGIRVNCIAPGIIDTSMLAGFSNADRAAMREEIPLGALGAPEDVARAALYLAGPGAAYVTGQVLGVNGGLCV